MGGAANDGEGPNDADLRDFNAGDTPAAQFQMEDQTFGPTPVVIPEPDSLILLGLALILIGGILLAAIRVQKSWSSTRSLRETQPQTDGTSFLKRIFPNGYGRRSAKSSPLRSRFG